MIASQQPLWSRIGLRLPTINLAAVWNSRALRVSVAVFLVLRIVTLLAGLLMVQDVPVGRPNLLWYDPARGIGNPSGITYEASLPANAPLAELMTPWRRYDTAWYILIALQGYQHDTRIVFPPLYPILISAALPFTGGNAVLAAVLISNIFCLVSFFLLYKLVQRVFNDDALATRTLILLAAFPTAFYLVAGYTESLFLAFTLGAFLAALDRRWWLAGGLAFLASLTRLQGAALFLPLGWIAYVQLRQTGLRAILARAPAVLGAPLGTLAFMAYLTVNNLGSLENAYAISWKLTTRMPWEAIGTYLQRLQAGIVPPHENNNAFILVLMAVLGLIVLWRFRRAFALYVWSTLFIVLLRYHFGSGLEGAQFESAFRYVLILFPCFIAAAMLFRGRYSRWVFIPLLLVMVQWQLYLLDNFIHWRWVA